MAIAPHGRTATNGGRPCGANAAGSTPASAKTSPVVRIGHGHSSESTRGCETKGRLLWMALGKNRQNSAREPGTSRRRSAPPLSLGEQQRRRSLAALLSRCRRRRGRAAPLVHTSGNCGTAGAGVGAVATVATGGRRRGRAAKRRRRSRVR